MPKIYIDTSEHEYGEARLLYDTGTDILTGCVRVGVYWGSEKNIRISLPPMGIADSGLSRRLRRHPSLRRACMHSCVSLRHIYNCGFQRRLLPQGVAQPDPVRTTLEMGLVNLR